MTPTPSQGAARVTVPREPTEAMRTAGVDAYVRECNAPMTTMRWCIQKVWEAMLSAAPQTHSTDDEARSGLLPCPFCGYGESKVSPWFDDVARRWRVGCGRCGCSTGISPRDDGQQPAIDRWNKRGLSRIPSEEAGDVREAITGAIDDLIGVTPTPSILTRRGRDEIADSILREFFLRAYRITPGGQT